MKSFILGILMMVGTLPTMAESYPYLTFELTDGTKVSVSVSSLTLTVNGTTLKAGSQTFTISNLSKMYFSSTDETSGATAIDELTADDLEGKEIYDLNGHKIELQITNYELPKLPRGVYIVKSKNKTCKIVVK
jgi:hypothetical protein